MPWKVRYDGIIFKVTEIIFFENLQIFTFFSFSCFSEILPEFDIFLNRMPVIAEALQSPGSNSLLCEKIRIIDILVFPEMRFKNDISQSNYIYHKKWPKIENSKIVSFCSISKSDTSKRNDFAR